MVRSILGVLRVLGELRIIIIAHALLRELL